MKVLIVHAHENPDSFCSALAMEAQFTFEKLDYSVHLSDLYNQGFNPVGSKGDFNKLSGSDHYKFASEQIHASKTNAFSKDLKVEMKALIEADILNFNFPLWWFGFPAILKGWVDRVMAYGVAYGGEYGFGKEGRFVGKKAFVTITTGSPESKYRPEGENKRTVEEIMRNIQEGILELVGFEVIDPFIAYGVSWIPQEQRALILSSYSTFLKDNFTIEE